MAAGLALGLVLMAAWAAASPAPAAPLLAAAGDIACDPGDPYFNHGMGTARHCRQLATSRLLRGADAVVPLGDTQGGHANFRNLSRSYDRSWGRYLRITRPVIGNHEYGPPHDPDLGAGGYWRYFGERRAGPRGQGWYSFDIGSWHVVGLNSLCLESGRPRFMQRKVGCGEGSPQLDWLRQDLALNRHRCILASWHHPRFTSASESSWDEVTPLWTALQDAGADVVLSAHQHTYERFARQLADGTRSSTGIRQFVVGTGGKSLGSFRSVKPNSQKRLLRLGVLRLRLRATNYQWKFVGSAAEKVHDRGKASCV